MSADLTRCSGCGGGMVDGELVHASFACPVVQLARSGARFARCRACGLQVDADGFCPDGCGEWK